MLSSDNGLVDTHVQHVNTYHIIIYNLYYTRSYICIRMSRTVILACQTHARRIFNSARLGMFLPELSNFCERLGNRWFFFSCLLIYVIRKYLCFWKYTVISTFSSKWIVNDPPLSLEIKHNICFIIFTLLTMFLYLYISNPMYKPIDRQPM